MEICDLRHGRDGASFAIEDFDEFGSADSEMASACK
jgi:hypothetical protein